MTYRHLAHLIVGAAVVLTLFASPAQAAGASGDLTPRQAMRIMQRAGFWGIGGVTHNGPYYYAAAIGPGNKRVRVTVDARTGEIVSIMARPRGAGAVTPPPNTAVLPEIPGVAVKPNPVPQRDYYQPPPAGNAIGTVPAPGTPAWTRAPVRCRATPAGFGGC